MSAELLSDPGATDGYPQAYPWLEPVAHRGNGRYRISGDAVPEVVAWRDGALTRMPAMSPHPDLMALVARATGARPRDLSPSYFSINEWRHVLVKRDGITLFAGRYDEPIEFVVEGVPRSAEAPRGLMPGQVWDGTRIGMRYTLTSTGTDVYGKRQNAAGAERKEYLSNFVPEVARWVTGWGKYKPGGGAIYINEARELFGPLGSGDQYLYFGYAPLDMWFPRPAVDDD